MNRVKYVPRFHAAWLLAAWLTMPVAGPRLYAQEDRSFGEEERITAIDLVLGFETGAVREWAAGDPTPGGLGASDFEVFYGVRPRQVVSVETAAAPWQIVVYLDAALTSSAGLRWAAATLAGRSGELTALGEVTILVADPAPWTLLPPTRDRDRLNASLSQLARFQEGRDEILALRAQALKRRRAESGLGDEVLAAAAEEARVVRARHDDLLLELAEQPMIGPYRVLLVATGGYDLEPLEFYRPLMDAPPAAGAPAAEAPASDASGIRLGGEIESLARTLAAYGWVVLPLLPPEGDPLKEGPRVGKLRLTGPSVDVEDQRPTPTDWEDYNRTVVRLFGGRLEGRRKPKRAEAFLELGAALHDQGKLADAEDALRQAIYHFAGDPKTARRQAIAFARLGAVLEAREQPQEANAALRLARRLDPGLEVAAAGPIAALLNPVAPLEMLARATAGAVVRGDTEFASALESLGRRARLTYQVAGLPDGEIHPLEVRFKNARPLIYPAWARDSTPESVAAARARRLLAGEPTGGEMALTAEFITTSGDGDARLGELHLALEPPAGEGSGADSGAAASTVLRLTLGVGGPEDEPAVEHRRLGLQGGSDPWSYRVGFEMPEGRSWLAVVVENLDSGAWGGRLIEVAMP